MEHADVAADAADAARLVFTTLPWDGAERFATPRPYFERLSRDAARLDIAWPKDQRHPEWPQLFGSCLDLTVQLRKSLKESLKQKPSCVSNNWPSPPGLLRVELTRRGRWQRRSLMKVRTELRALPASDSGPWQAISHPAPWFGSRLSGAKHGAWGAYRDATQRARQKGADVALLFHEDLLVDGDRCSVLLRVRGATELLMPAEAESVPSVAVTALRSGLSVTPTGGLRRKQLMEADEVLVVGSGVGLRRLSHLDGQPFAGDDWGYRRSMAAMEATRESRWCILAALRFDVSSA
eukprot:s3309_g2.t1